MSFRRDRSLARSRRGRCPFPGHEGCAGSGHGPPPWAWHHHHGRHHAHGGRKLFWRVYLHGLVLLLGVVLALGAIGWALGRGNNLWSQSHELRTQLESTGPGLWTDRAKVDAVLREASDRANAEITVYSAFNQLLGTTVDPPLPPLPLERLQGLGEGPAPAGRRYTMVLPLRPGPGGYPAAYALAEWRGPGIRELMRGGMYLLAILFVLALGSVPLVMSIVAPLERLTRAARALGSGDLSTRSGIRRRDEVGELASAFDEMAERLQRLVLNERELLANVSHELRTPLSRIRVALELAAEGDAARAQRYLREIGADLAELEQLVEDVLTTARLESRAQTGEGFPIHPAKVSAAELLEAAARRFREAWPERTLVSELPAALPVIEADAVLLRRVVDNLLDNARKYSEDGAPVRLGAEVDPDGALRIWVRDEGIGLGEEDRKQLFTPFFRSDRSRQRGTGGVGLGLALARRIVEAHGGTLGVESAVGKGSTFTVRLPPAAEAASNSA